MGISRRELIRVGTLAGVSAMVPVDGLEAAGRVIFEPPDSAVRTRRGPLPIRSVFREQLGRYFLAQRPGHRSLRLRLVEVADPITAREAGTLGSEDVFSVSFRGPASAPLSQGTYQIKGPRFGTLEIFLVPVGRQRGGSRLYEAAFNRAAGA